VKISSQNACIWVFLDDVFGDECFNGFVKCLLVWFVACSVVLITLLYLSC